MWFHFGPFGWLKLSCLIFTVYVKFPVFLNLWFSASFHCGWRSYWYFKCIDWLYDITYGLSWRTSHVHLTWWRILLRLEEVLYTHLSDVLYLLIDLLSRYSITESGILKSPTVVIELFSLPPFNSMNICFVYFEALLFSAYMFIMDRSGWIVSFVNM